MTAVFQQDLDVDQGADFTFTTIPWLVGGAAVDFTSAAARMMVRRCVDSDDVIASITNVSGDAGAVTPNGTAGTATINLTKATTAGFPRGPLRFDVMIDFPNGTTKKLLSGRLLVGLSVTR